jgi:enoyl-CoA hydratase
MRHRETIASCFSATSVSEIVERLRSWNGPDRQWADAVADEIEAKSPTSLAIAFRQLREGRGLPLHEALALEYRIACRMVLHPDLAEGVRALLLDKDGAPRWSPGRLAEVAATMFDEFFAPLETGELELEVRRPPTLVDNS